PPEQKSGYQSNMEGIQTESVPDRYILSQNHPNPFNPTTDIHYGLSKDAHVVLKVYDVLGREVSTLVSETQIAGYKTVSFDASLLPSGVYFYRLSAGSLSGQAGKFSAIKKMLLVQ
ncbi:MAG: T9SS type A sorting domain-containing protein, partial [Bacteroidota bacterium]|nr:T9SS type A sorting domain-containing protein [Bacteroidota bacterium]